MSLLPSDPLDTKTPGGLYLCQVSDSISCGACCGLYNISHTGKDDLTRLLSERSERFSRVPRNMDAVVAFGKNNLHLESRTFPLENFHHCPYLGLILPEQKTVGCLLHPMGEGNSGTDLRGVSHWGGMACHMFFCPTCRELPVWIKELIRWAAPDWYHYGMMVTEHDLWNALWELVSEKMDAPVDQLEIIPSKSLRDALGSFMCLKASWPYMASPPIFAHDMFKSPDNEPPQLTYPGEGVTGPVDIILKRLRSVFECEQDVTDAVSVIYRTVDSICMALSVENT